MNKKILKVAVVDDHTLFREGLKSLLEEEPTVQILFGAGNGIELQKKLNAGHIPDVVLMDINMPGMDGYEATSWIRKSFPLVKVLALSMYEDDISIIKMMKKGACGYILKECTAEELVRALISVYQQGYFLNELVSGRLIHSIRTSDQSDGSSSKRLTDKETEFLVLCCSELTYKEIANEMSISPRTVDSYREVVFEKLQLKSRIGIVLYAIKNGIVSL